MYMGRTRRALVCAAITGAALLALSGLAWARAGGRLSVVIPRSVLAGAVVHIPGQVTGGGSTAALRVRGRHWTTLAKGRVGSALGRFDIRWRPARRAETLTLQVVILQGRRVVFASRTARVRVARGHFAPRKKAVVSSPARVAALPLPGNSGTVALNGSPAVSPGQVLAVGYGLKSPDGFLGKVTAVSSGGGQTLLQTQPASLAQAGAVGNLDLATFKQVGSGAGTRRARAIGHAASFSAQAFNPELSKAIKCTDGASASITGSVSVSVVPALHASFSLFHGLSSASFSLTGAARAGLTASAATSAECKLDSTELLRDPLHIATFEGAIGPIPVVIVLQGQLFVDGDLSGDANVQSSVNASDSVTGGISYANHRFSPIFAGPNASFTFSPPSVTATGDAKADVEPALQMLLYGVGGPQLGIKGGLDLQADTTKTPWWTLTAPVSLEASLTAPDLDLESGNLTLYHHTFTVATASGPFGGGHVNNPPPPPPPGPARGISDYSATPDLACTLTTNEDLADEFYTDGSGNDACGTFLSLDGTLYGPSDVPAGGDLGDYVWWSPISQFTAGGGTPGDPFVITTTVAAGDTGVELTEIDTWTEGGNAVDSSMSVTGPPGDTDSALLYRGADCYVGDADTGLGSYDTSSGTAACLRDNGDGSTSTAEQLIPLSGGSTSVEDDYSQVWSDIGFQEPLPDTCQCGEYIDDGFATEWPLQLNGTAPVGDSSRFAFATVPGSSAASEEALRALRRGRSTKPLDRRPS